MSKTILIFGLLLTFSFGLKAQNYFGFEGGINLSGINLDREAGARVLQKITPYYGFTYTFIPEGKKPGITINVNVVDNGFQEIASDTIITHQLRGYELNVLSHLRIQIRKTRLFANLGPGISYMPVTITDYPETSLLPPFEEPNLNKVYMTIGGGGGVTQSIGPIDITVFGHLAYFISDVYRDAFWDSNIVAVKGGMRLQFGF